MNGTEKTVVRTACGWRLTNGRLGGVAVRGPAEGGSLTDLAAVLASGVTAAEVNRAFADAASGRLAGVARYSSDPLVSRDIIGDPASCVRLRPDPGSRDPAQGIRWYDNEWAYSCRLADLAALVGRSSSRTR